MTKMESANLIIKNKGNCANTGFCMKCKNCCLDKVCSAWITDSFEDEYDLKLAIEWKKEHKNDT